jgi:hypothetical protein
VSQNTATLPLRSKSSGIIDAQCAGGFSSMLANLGSEYPQSLEKQTLAAFAATSPLGQEQTCNRAVFKQVYEIIVPVMNI